MDEMITMQPTPMIGAEQLQELTRTLQKYKAGKAHTERRIVNSEEWWKLRNSNVENSATVKASSFKSASGWLHNVIVSKHADAMEAYPEPNILPREEGDKQEANILSKIIPVIMEQNNFEATYSDCMWQKLKTGTGVYKVTWDATKLNGLGDISVTRCNLLNLYWEPGITDIQKSRYFFHTELIDKDLLEEQYPQLKDKLNGNQIVSTRFLYDDNVSTDNKATLIECYYHKGGLLHYIKYVNDEVLFASEDDPTMAQRGFYDHGLYPFVFDSLFPIEGSPCGYGFVDLCRNPQTQVDMLNTAFIKNAMSACTPRYFERVDGSVNEEELLDLTKAIIHVNGNLGEDSVRQLIASPMSGVYVSMRDGIINELRETSGNTETATGTTSAGVTAASAIAALQEASGKGSRDSNLAAYRAYNQIVSFVIELIRQFYDMPRQFRIVGQMGMEQFVTYTNSGIQPVPQGAPYGVDLGYRKPEFDIKISAQKKSIYTKVTQNEMALQFFQLGFFNPQLTDQALMCLDLMEFDGKDGLMQKISQQGRLFDAFMQLGQLALGMAQQFDPNMMPAIMQMIAAAGGQQMQSPGGRALASIDPDNPQRGNSGGETRVNNARAAARQKSQPEGGAVTGGARG